MLKYPLSKKNNNSVKTDLIYTKSGFLETNARNEARSYNKAMGCYRY